MMRLLEETEREREHAMPAVIIAENVRGLRPYLPVLRLEYECHGYTAHIEMFNSKYWNVPQNRDRYAVVGTRNKKNLSFTFPKEQHEFVPKLSDYLEKDVPEKYYLPDEKAQTIIAQAMEKLEKMGKCHACITPDRINKRQNGPRAKAEDEPMFIICGCQLPPPVLSSSFSSSRMITPCKSWAVSVNIGSSSAFAEGLTPTLKPTRARG